MDKSPRLEGFLERWWTEAGKGRLPKKLKPLLHQVLKADTLSEAHRLAFEAIDAVRPVNGEMALRLTRSLKET